MACISSEVQGILVNEITLPLPPCCSEEHLANRAQKIQCEKSTRFQSRKQKCGFCKLQTCEFSFNCG